MYSSLIQNRWQRRTHQTDENGTAVPLDELDLESFGAASYTIIVAKFIDVGRVILLDAKMLSCICI